MKPNKNIFISLFAVAMFVWTLWKYVDLDKPLSPEQKFINDCISASKVLSSQPKEKATEVCKCAYDEIEAEYSYEHLDSLYAANKDSAEQLIQPIMKKCIKPISYGDEMIKSCINASETLSKLPFEHAKNICICMHENLERKFPFDALDSLLISNKDSLKILIGPLTTKCFEPYLNINSNE